MKNDSKLFKMVVYVLLIAIASLILVSSTYAKYTREISSSDTAIVAKFKVGSNAETSFDLFQTAKETDGITADTDVADGKIAPGTGGKFAITLTNDSDVAVNYTLSVEEDGNTEAVPIEYSLDGITYVTAADMAKQIAATDKLEIGSVTQTSKEVVVYWRWAFEGSQSTNFKTTQTNITDTALGEKETPVEFKVTVKANFEQVD